MQDMPTGWFTHRREQNGFRPESVQLYGHMAADRLPWEASRTEHALRHQLNRREQRIGKLLVDGWCHETRTAYQFQGCFFHGCPCTGKQGERLFGMVVCDIRVAENLRQHFAEMLPVFKNNTDSRDYIGPFMRQYTKDNDMMSTQRRMLVGSYHGEKPLLATPSLQWYLSHGLVVDHVYQIIEFQPLSSLW
ncbi:hypothetical protein NP493_5963g00000 [Ridgeia piscesae]|uniref:Uncharacterized protein n=2 Tax=Ridgeia piscesae TaxID=27915 RepID=A0AAD9IT76_RIDPI|nr:hypothetical protein NP493_8138g00002 [Ridgeia piscesae]KAK2139710.1 hypothetical protein NP493_6233g00001 [Ridgeia piscesae]KAK2140133.1 hypothetical protein NP493_5963g00000 [Ridgeia piscesae]